MRKIVFVTGTDTHVGKSVVSGLLLAEAKRQGLSTAGLKPIASGCYQTSAGLRNVDAEILRLFATQGLPYDAVNPVAIEAPIAPHIGLKQQNLALRAQEIASLNLLAIPQETDFTLVEGAGGWRVPLSGGDYFSDLAAAFTSDIVLVVGIRLGCINHALLSAEAIKREGLNLVGWVANCLEPDMLKPEESINAIEQALGIAPMAVLPHAEVRQGYQFGSEHAFERAVEVELERIDALTSAVFGAFDGVYSQGS